MGEVLKRLNGTISNTIVGLVSTVGPNPTLSAAYKIPHGSGVTHDALCTYCRT